MIIIIITLMISKKISEVNHDYLLCMLVIWDESGTSCLIIILGQGDLLCLMSSQTKTYSWIACFYHAWAHVYIWCWWSINALMNNDASRRTVIFCNNTTQGEPYGDLAFIQTLFCILMMKHFTETSSCLILLHTTSAGR